MSKLPRGMAQRNVEVTLSWPVLPNGITWSMTVPASQVQAATRALVALWGPLEKEFQRLPVPGPDTIPGGSVVEEPGDDFWEAMAPPRKVGF